MLVKFRLNGKEVEVDASPNEILLDTLRLKLGVRSVKRGCERGECGTCTVLLNGDPVTSCLILTPQVDGAEVITVEGLENDPKFKELVENFVNEGAIQCGFCTPGFLLTAYAAMVKQKIKTLEDVRKSLEGNLCRCTGYVKIIEAVAKTALK
ncbi:MAG: (2Fe-2S)-binding protein [Desulfurococcaceae archaeon]|jgi:carbon-monoxide dehydrogenase small subunit|nr:(2Fe-2S)-binding protein [Desulfurococcaceae archaeon]